MPPEATNTTSKRAQGMITKARLVLVLACMSVFRLVRLAITTHPYSPVPSNPFLKTNQTISTPSPALTIKELKLLMDLISQKAPCNLLIFSLEPEYILLSEINSRGTTIMLEDSPAKLQLLARRSNNTNTRIIRKVEHAMPAKEAYRALEQARKEPSCWPRGSGPRLQASKCRLALTALPKEVYKDRWDVIIVDGPSGNRQDAPGRMAAIYSAGLLARSSGNRTNVVVHDVDRVIEKWFSWEFLCEDNFVSSRGKFWNFLLEGANHSNSSTSFCS